MRKRQVWRFFCGFCKRSSGQRIAMEKHEARCFYNPERLCELCMEDQLVQQPMTKLIAILGAGGLAGLREITEECPACICAAITQYRAGEVANGESLGDVEYFDFDFDFGAGMKKWRDDCRGRYSDAY